MHWKRKKTECTIVWVLKRDRNHRSKRLFSLFPRDIRPNEIHPPFFNVALPLGVETALATLQDKIYNVLLERNRQEYREAWSHLYKRFLLGCSFSASEILPAVKDNICYVLNDSSEMIYIFSSLFTKLWFIKLLCYQLFGLFRVHLRYHSGEPSKLYIYIYLTYVLYLRFLPWEKTLILSSFFNFLYSQIKPVLFFKEIFSNSLNIKLIILILLNVGIYLYI